MLLNMSVATLPGLTETAVTSGCRRRCGRPGRDRFRTALLDAPACCGESLSGRRALLAQCGTEHVSYLHPREHLSSHQLSRMQHVHELAAPIGCVPVGRVAHDLAVAAETERGGLKVSPTSDVDDPTLHMRH